MRRTIGIVAAIALLIFPHRTLAGQVVVVEGPSKPYAHEGEKASPRGPDPTTFARFYVSAAAGAPGAYADSGSTAQWQVPSVAGFQFPSVRLSISVAPQIFAADSDPSARSERSFGSDLMRLNAHVRADALDATGRPLVSSGSSTIVLMISPSEPVTFSPQITATQSEAKAAFDLALKHFGPVGAIAASFESAFRRPAGLGETAYQSAASEFGWIWYRSGTAPIDGIHGTAALFQVPASAASLRLSVDVITDWRRSGTWIKTYDLTVALTPQTK